MDMVSYEINATPRAPQFYFSFRKIYSFKNYFFLKMLAEAYENFFLTVVESSQVTLYNKEECQIVSESEINK